MKFIKQQEINNIIGECESMEELNRLARLQQIYIEEITNKLGLIWILKVKLDKIEEILENGR